MFDIREFTESSALLGDPDALRARWGEEGYLFFRGLLDPQLLAWGHQRYREALAGEGLIKLTRPDAPVWTGSEPKTRRPCDVLGTTVSERIKADPVLNATLAKVFDDGVVWLPIVAHRSGLPSGPVTEAQDIFVQRHQDGPFNEGMQFAVCWIPMRDVKRSHGGFAIVPGSHRLGLLHDEAHEFRIPRETILDGDWRSTDFRAGDVLMFHYMTVHSALPNESDEIRTSIDIRAVPTHSPQPITGSVERIDGTNVVILTEKGERVTIRVDEETFIRDMNPRPRVPLAELGRIAFPGAHVIAMLDETGHTNVLRRNFY